ncbi:hypothetical protein [Mixta intestinalis]|jgi:hypothetical protein|uniref:hypothetical protein n=1 Tax=Mixta intestinalis TaxID=1615494 RepID=UPI00136B9474|nr:hypothetical protein [Mixta intestinalis]
MTIGSVPLFFMPAPAVLAEKYRKRVKSVQKACLQVFTLTQQNAAYSPVTERQRQHFNVA